jgi:hypothetical protein
VANAQADVAQIESAANAVSGQREVASQEIADQIAKARDRGAEIAKIANDLGVLANVAGSVSLARSYARRANRDEGLANRYTFAWLALAALSVVGAAVVARP